MIQRMDSNNRMSQIVVYNGVVYLAGQVDETDKGGPIKEQTANVLKQIDELLAKAGTDKT